MTILLAVITTTFLVAALAAILAWATFTMWQDFWNSLTSVSSPMIRNITPGSTWQHYRSKGTYKIVAISSPGRRPINAIEVGTFYGANDASEVTLFECPVAGEESYFVYAGDVTGLQVFYVSSEGLRWYRSTSSFLGTASSNQLRFTEVKEAQGNSTLGDDN